MKTSFIRYKRYTGLMVVSAVLAISCSQPKQEVDNTPHEDEGTIELTQKQYDLAKIKSGKIEKRTIGSELRVNGHIDVPPQNNISINMPYGGFVKYTNMLPGTKVKKGQFLVSIENPEFIQFQQDYLESRAKREFLKMEYERQKNLFEERVASSKSFQLAKSNFLANEARLQSMKARLKLIGLSSEKITNGEITALANIYSPVDGSVREVYTNIGKYINPMDVIMDITNSEDLHVELSVYEKDIFKIKEGQRIRFSMANDTELWQEAVVFLVGSSVREDRSITVHGHLIRTPDNPIGNSDLIPGMYVAAKIETGSSEVWAVPEESVVRFASSHFIFSATGSGQEYGQTVHSFEMLEIEKGSTEDEYTEVRLKNTDLDPNTIKVVTQGAFTLLAKAKNSEEDGGHGH